MWIRCLECSGREATPCDCDLYDGFGMIHLPSPSLGESHHTWMPLAWTGRSEFWHIFCILTVVELWFHIWDHFQDFCARSGADAHHWEGVWRWSVARLKVESPAYALLPRHINTEHWDMTANMRQVSQISSELVNQCATMGSTHVAQRKKMGCKKQGLGASTFFPPFWGMEVVGMQLMIDF